MDPVIDVVTLFFDGASGKECSQILRMLNLGRFAIDEAISKAEAGLSPERKGEFSPDVFSTQRLYFLCTEDTSSFSSLNEQEKQSFNSMVHHRFRIQKLVAAFNEKVAEEVWGPLTETAY